MSVPAFCLQAHSQASKSVGSAPIEDEARSVGCLEEGAGISLTAGALIDGLRTRRGHAFNRPDLPHHLKECLIDVGSGLGRGLEKRTAPPLSKMLALLSGHLSLRCQVHLVGDQHDWRRLRRIDLFHFADVAAKSVHLFKGCTLCDTVHNEESFTPPDPLRTECRVLFLTGRIQYVEYTGDAVGHRLPLVGRLDRGVVVLDKMAGTHLDREGSFSYAPTAEDSD